MWLLYVGIHYYTHQYSYSFCYCIDQWLFTITESTNMFTVCSFKCHYTKGKYVLLTKQLPITCLLLILIAICISENLTLIKYWSLDTYHWLDYVGQWKQHFTVVLCITACCTLYLEAVCYSCTNNIHSTKILKHYQEFMMSLTLASITAFHKGSITQNIYKLNQKLYNQLNK